MLQQIKKISLFVFGLFLLQCTLLRKDVETYTQYITTDTSKIKINIVKEPGQKTQYNNTVRYYWYENNEVFSTYGGAGGKLLHGMYTSYYHDKNLMNKGNMYLGRKTGVWKYWHKNGNLEKTENYRNGLLHGTVAIYKEDGTLQKKKNYKNGTLHGEYTLYKNGLPVKTLEYDKGQCIVDEPENTETKGKGEPQKQDTVKKEIAIPVDSLKNRVIKGLNIRKGNKDH